MHLSSHTYKTYFTSYTPCPIYQIQPWFPFRLCSLSGNGFISLKIQTKALFTSKIPEVSLSPYSTGRWRSDWSVTFPQNPSGASAAVKGVTKVQSHLFEDGNVQLISSKEISDTITVTVSVSSFPSGFHWRKKMFRKIRYKIIHQCWLLLLFMKSWKFPVYIQRCNLRSDRFHLLKKIAIKWLIDDFRFTTTFDNNYRYDLKKAEK